MTQETVRALSDADLSQVVAWAQAEIKARAEKRKQETIARIKELAGTVGVTVAIGGQRGRPKKAPTKMMCVKTDCHCFIADTKRSL